MANVRISRILRAAAWALLALPMVGCGGGGPSGIYVPAHPDSQMVFVEKFDFQSGGKVGVTAFGTTAVGEFVVGDDGRIRIIMPQGNAITMAKGSGGCLVAESDPGIVAEAAKDGVDLNELGRYCRQ